MVTVLPGAAARATEEPEAGKLLMMNAIRLVECIAFMLMQDDQILAEKRSRTL
jgi:hypothetical protein